MHVGLRGENLDESVDFCTKLLGTGPTLVRPSDSCCPDTRR